MRAAALMVVSTVGAWTVLSGALAASGASPVASLDASGGALATVSRPDSAAGSVAMLPKTDPRTTQFAPDAMPGNGQRVGWRNGPIPPALVYVGSVPGSPSGRFDATPLVAARQTGLAQSALSPLLAQIAPLIERFPAAAGVAVIDLQTGERVGINARQQFQAASTIKFYVALSAFRDVADGLYPLDAIRADLAATMQQYGNDAARRLTNRTRIPVINNRLAHWGLRDTVITHPAGFEQEPHPLYLDTDNQNWTSPSDAAHALNALYNSLVLDPILSRVLLEDLEQRPRWFGIEGAVPDGEGRVYYKHGYLPAFDHASVNDIGIVEFEREGRTYAYAIAIYTQARSRSSRPGI